MFVSHSVAVAAYLASGLRLPVALSPAAARYNAAHPRTQAGLAEVQAEADFRPLPAFLVALWGTTNDELLRAARVDARNAQIARESN